MFHVPIVMLSLSRIFDDTPVAYLTPLSWCTAEGAVLVDKGGYRSGMVWLCSLQVEHVAVELVVDPSAHLALVFEV